ncbi:MAG: phage holin family protein [Brevundimonas sp.]|uniref:phage holin family protein n=1 Tax=Brevundimonas sp. TaxID=1871086 RepID=UPI002ABB5497|nr:phage holin family protein [Brevundimonas sp.]MDZ4107996.1 phage holin family protein [Brevundimonas sp.]
MLRFIVQFLVTCLALWLAAQVVTGVRFDDTPTLLLAAILLGVANAIVRPILTVLTFPLTIITFGLFLLVVNAAVIGLVAALLGGFVVDGLWAGVGAAIVTGVVSWIAGWFIGDKRG